MAVTPDPQVQAVRDAGKEAYHVTEHPLGIEVERKPRRRNDSDDKQHAYNHGDDAGDPLYAETFLKENRCEHGRVNGPRVDEERSVRQGRILRRDNVETRKQAKKHAREHHGGRHARFSDLLQVATREQHEDQRKRNESDEIATERDEVAGSVDESSERTDAAHCRRRQKHEDEAFEFVFRLFVHCPSLTR